MSKWTKVRSIIIALMAGVGVVAEILGVDGTMNIGLMMTLFLWLMIEDIERNDEGYHLAA